MLSLVIDESRKELAEMELALKKYDRELMRKIIHRMMPVWEILGKERLLREFQKRNYIIMKVLMKSLGNMPGRLLTFLKN